MAAAHPHPSAIVATAASTYVILLTSAQNLSLPTSDLRSNLKAISSLHATLTTGLALYALSQPWPVNPTLAPLDGRFGQSTFASDAANPMVAGSSAIGNAVTGLETGYLLFDTLALVYASHRNLRVVPTRTQQRQGPVAAAGGKISTLPAAIADLARKDPLTLFHHLSLLAGLGMLQYFIAHGRARGVYIIVAFALMNASTPLLHFRWYRRKVTGRGSLVLDVALAAVFAAARLGSVWWVLAQYGAWHGGVGAWAAISGQRWICQVGTALLVGLNGVWLGTLLKSIARRTVAVLTTKGKQAPPPSR